MAVYLTLAFLTAVCPFQLGHCQTRTVIKIKPPVLTLTPDTLLTGDTVNVSCEPPLDTGGELRGLLIRRVLPSYPAKEHLGRLVVNANQSINGGAPVLVMTSLQGAVLSGSVGERCITLTMLEANFRDAGKYICYAFIRMLKVDPYISFRNLTVTVQKDGGGMTCPRQWFTGERVTLAFRLNRTNFPSACNSGTDNLPRFQRSADGEAAFTTVCTVADVAAPDTCGSGAFRSGTLGCGCTGKDSDGNPLLQYNFIAHETAGGWWRPFLRCTDVVGSQQLSFTTWDCDGKIVVQKSTATPSNKVTNAAGADIKSKVSIWLIIAVVVLLTTGLALSASVGYLYGRKFGSQRSEDSSTKTAAPPSPDIDADKNEPAPVYIPISIGAIATPSLAPRPPILVTRRDFSPEASEVDDVSVTDSELLGNEDESEAPEERSKILMDSIQYIGPA